jgi:hypothetical protein
VNLPRSSRRWSHSIAAVAALVLTPATAHAQNEGEEPRAPNLPVVSLKFALQSSVASLHHVGFLQNGVSLAAGAQRGNLGAYVLAEIELGDTARGLATNHQSLGGELQWRATSFWRLGGGAYFERLAVKRITTAGSLEGFGFGAFLSTELDVYRFGPRDDHGFFLGLRASDDGLGEQALLEARALAGFRY